MQKKFRLKIDDIRLAELAKSMGLSLESVKTLSLRAPLDTKTAINLRSNLLNEHSNKTKKKSVGFATDLPSPKSRDQISLFAVDEEEDYVASTRQTCTQVQRGRQLDTSSAISLSSAKVVDRVVELEIIPNRPRIEVELQQAFRGPFTDSTPCTPVR